MKEKEKAAVLDKKTVKNELNPMTKDATAEVASKGKKSPVKAATASSGSTGGGGGAVNDGSQDTHSLRSKSASAEEISPIYTYKRMIIEGIKWYDETTYTKPPLRKPRTPTSVMRAAPDRRRLKSKRAVEAGGTVGQGLTLTTVSGGPNTALFDGQKPDIYLLHEIYGSKKALNSPDASKAEAGTAAAGGGTVSAFRHPFKYYGWKILIAFVTLLPILLLIALFVWYYFFTPRVTSTEDTTEDPTEAATTRMTITTTNLNQTTNRTKI